MKFWIFVFALFLFSVSFAYANVIITEIMYDVEGSDAGREWIEIQNTGPQIDLTGWKLFENGVNHGLVLAKGNIFIPQNEFAIIADNADKFLLDWPDFSGTIFDSSFSLSNSGETIILRDAGLGDSDSVSYLSDWGANGDRNSLQKINNEWASASPTPGEGNSETTIEQEISPPYEGGAGGGSIPEPKSSPFEAYAGKDKSVLAGAEVYFEGQTEGVSEDLIPKTRFLWNFGDGATGEGKTIKHIFQYPGNYIVNLNISFGAFSSSDSARVIVSPAGISVSEIKPGAFLEIENGAGKISDVSGFSLQINDSKVFIFPKDSMVSQNSFLALDVSALGFEIPSAGEVKILYPNGKILFSSKYEAKDLSEKESINFNGEKWVKSEITPGIKNFIKKEFVKQEKITPPPRPSPLIVRGWGEGGGVTGIEEKGQASAITASFWSEIKWLIFGLGFGILLGFLYIFLKRHFKPVSAL